MKIIFLLALLFSNAFAYKTQSTYIKNINIVDVKTKKLINNKNILIRNGKIERISSKEINKNSLKDLITIDGTDKYIIPGLIDAHGHLSSTHSDRDRNQKFFVDEQKLLLVYGVTTVRNMKSFKEQVNYAKLIESRKIFAPRLSVASPALDDRKDTVFPEGQNYKCWTTWSNCSIKNLEGAKLLVEKFTNSGFDLIKLRAPLSKENLVYFSKEFKNRGIKVGGHVDDYKLLPLVFREDLFNSIEHMHGYFTLTQKNNSPFRAVGPKEAEIIDFLQLTSFHQDKFKMYKLLSNAQRNFTGYIVPTLIIHQYAHLQFDGVFEMNKLPSSKYLDKCTLKQESDYLKELSKMPTIKKYKSYKGKNTYTKSFKNILKLIKKMHSYDLKLGLGTDFNQFGVVPGPSIHKELALYVKAGLKPIDALRAATFNNAQLLGLENVGYIAEDAIADLVILNSNPLDKIKNTRDINAVIRDGVLMNLKTIKKIKRDIILKAKKHSCKS